MAKCVNLCAVFLFSRLPWFFLVRLLILRQSMAQKELFPEQMDRNTKLFVAAAHYHEKSESATGTQLHKTAWTRFHLQFCN